MIFDLPTTFSSIFSFIMNQGYFFIFLLMFLEGPIVTSAAAFAASLGYLNIYIIIILSILGNLVPDTLFFFIGRLGRKKSVESYMVRLGLTASRIKNIEKNLKNHSIKTLIIVKITPFLPLPGIILAGFMKVPIRKFFYVDILFNIVATMIFAGFGFYFGIATDSLFKYLKIGEYALVLIIPLILLSYWIYKKLLKRLRNIKLVGLV